VLHANRTNGGRPAGFIRSNKISLILFFFRLWPRLLLAHPGDGEIRAVTACSTIARFPGSLLGIAESPAVSRHYPRRSEESPSHAEAKTDWSAVPPCAFESPLALTALGLIARAFKGSTGCFSLTSLSQALGRWREGNWRNCRLDWVFATGSANGNHGIAHIFITACNFAASRAFLCAEADGHSG